MMNITVEQVYTSVACNRTPEIVDWNSDGLICYGANNAVVIYDLKNNTSDPLTVLSHHHSRVNSVKWIYKPDNTCTELISCSADKTAAIWTVKSGLWRVTSELIGHTDGVSCVFGVYTEDYLTLYTASTDSTIRVWKKCNGEITHQQTINLSSGLCLTLHACLLPAVNKPVLFAALDDHKIHIFSGDEYHRVHTLVGHEDWVRGLDVMRVDDTTLLLASASQDTYIRIWSIQAHRIQEPVSGIKVEEKVFQAHGQNWAVKLDAVLAGHEGWVYGVQWQPGSKASKPIHRLLSSSLDKTLIIWEPENAPTRGEGDGQGVWTERVRVGEVGGNGLGFYGSRFEPGGDAFMGHGYNGSFHIWRLCKETKQWQPAVVPGGHFSAVEDVRWEPQGRYLVSVSADQTTRVHAPWTTTHGTVHWHEIARPQVHGYDMSSLAILSPTTFASSAEEKVIRVFKAPHNFVQNYQNICKEVLVEGETGGPEGASVPSLGLSNKAVFNADDGQEVDDDNDGYFTPLHLIEPPTEETLMQNTLWPESQKLYGHGYEVFALDASADGALLASACKATVAEHAAVIIWNTTSWQQVQKLVSHTLTVTQLAFSPDSRHLLSVSRDRKWTLYKRKQDSDSFAMVASTDKTNGVHTRIIWCCAWAHDGQVFGTGSRDGKVCIWSKAGTTSESSLGDYGLLGKPLEVPNASITAVAFAPILLSGARVLAAGFESGHIRIYSYNTGVWKQLTELDNSAGHHLTVKRLTFRPREVATSKDQLLASCGTDNLVRIHRIVIS